MSDYGKFVRDRITQLRLQKGISEYQLSYDLGHSRSYIYNITSGKALPPLTGLFAICEYFDITPCEFFDVKLSAFAAGSGSMTQDQTQDQTQSQTQDRAQNQSCKQTEVNTADREQARLQIRDRLQISDQAEAQYQDRLQQQDQTRSCFTDTEQHWAREQIGSAYSWGLINGYPNGDFNPDGVISGTEGVLMMSRLMNCLNVEESQADPETSIDLNLVPEWAREQIQEESALKIAAQSQCYGEAQLNRLQFAVMLAKALGVEPEEVTEDTVVFLDQSEIPQEDLDYISALRTLGIIQGTDGCFCADQTVTRAEAAAMLTRILEALE